MSITEKRFSFKDLETTNVLIKDLRGVDSIDTLLNKGIFKNLNITDQIKPLLSLGQSLDVNKALNEIKGAGLNGLKNLGGDVVQRISNLADSNITNLVNKSISEVDSLVNGISGGIASTIKSTIRQFDPSGYLNVVNDLVSNVPSGITSTINGISSVVNTTLKTASDYSSLIGDVTRGAYSAILDTTSEVENTITALTKQASSVGLGGVFKAFDEVYGIKENQGLNSSSVRGIISAGENLLEHLENNKLSTVAMDLLNSSVSPYISTARTSFVNTITSTFDERQLNTNNLSSNIIDRLDELLPNWTNSPTNNNLLSIENITSTNSGIKSILKNAIHQVPVSTQNPTTDDSNLDFLYVATNFLSDSQSTLKKEFNEIVNWAR